MALKNTRVRFGGPEVATIANATAFAIGPLLQLAFLPYFRTQLGAAGLGLYGLLVVGWNLLSAFEAVVGPGLQRRIARSGRAESARAIAIAIEGYAWAIVALTLIGCAVLAWLAPDLRFGSSNASVPILVLVAATVVRLPPLLYGVLLTALRAPWQLAAWRASGEILRIVGAAFALHATSGSVSMFTSWQGIAIAAQAIAGAILLRVLWPRPALSDDSRVTSAPRASIASVVMSDARIALPLLLGLLMAQWDRLALAAVGAWVPLGQYTLAFMLASAQTFLSSAAVAVVAPQVAAATGAGHAAGDLPIALIRRVGLVVGINCGVFAGAATAVADALLQWFGESSAHPTIVLAVTALWAFAIGAAVNYAFQLGIAAGEERRVLKSIARMALPYGVAVVVAAWLKSAEYMALAMAAINGAWMILLAFGRGDDRAKLMRTAVRAAMLGVVAGGAVGLAASWMTRLLMGPPADRWSMAAWLLAMALAGLAATLTALTRPQPRTT